MRESEKLTNRQLLAITQIIASSTLEEARKKARISKGTLYAWLKDETFKTELKQQRDKVVKEALGRLKYAMTKAVNNLIKLIDSPRPSLRRWVCKDIIEYNQKTIELEDIEERLDKIERIISERRGYKWMA